MWTIQQKKKHEGGVKHEIRVEYKGGVKHEGELKHEVRVEYMCGVRVE